MKNMLLKYMSALLAVWYCLSIIGFDVHSCASTGNTFVSSILAGTSCEDIHPEHDCTCHGSCCHSHEEPSSDGIEKNHDCCTNEIEVLESEGVAHSNDEVYGTLCCSFEFSYIKSDLSVFLRECTYEVFCHPDSWDVVRPDQQAVLSVWRI